MKDRPITGKELNEQKFDLREQLAKEGLSKTCGKKNMENKNRWER